MSRTDVHRPWWVQEADHSEKRWVRGVDGCSWPYYRLCSCDLCHGPGWPCTPGARQDRYAAKRKIRTNPEDA